MATNDTKNNASQTLFRFVSLRNPQLTETKAVNLGFVHKPAALASSFDAVINPGDTALAKFQAMERAAKSFNATGYQSENEIEGGSLSEALRIGRKIAKRETISSLDETTAKNLYNSGAIQSKMGQVWDNLIYQTVTQKNFYVKEALIHILKALHYGYVADLPVTPELIKINGDDLKAKALEARVVLPMKFFGDGYEGEQPSTNPSGNAFQVNVSKIGNGVINGTPIPVSLQEQLKAEGERIADLSKTALEKEGLEKLKTELEGIQKTFYKLRTKAYSIAQNEYKAKYQQEINDYEDRVESIEEKIKQGGLSPEQIQALYAELGELKVPPFNFEYKSEINFEDLKSKLSLESFKLFIHTFTETSNGERPADGFDFSNITVLSERSLKLGDITVSITDEYDTFAEIFEKLDEDTSLNTDTLFRKSPLPEKKYANVGGVLVPVVNSYSPASRVVSRSYYLQASYEPLYSRMPGVVTFYYQAESNAWGAASVKITASTDYGMHEESFSNVNVINQKVTLPLFLVDKFGKVIRSLSIKIYFNNGKEASLNFSGVEINQPYTGILYSEDVNDDTGNPPQPGTFIPKHFGVKRLGVADYLKVEQSVHAYVPGEVSNIENVMASELRHKSSVARDYSEVIDTTSESVETEKISDTTKAERSEMQTEVAKELEKQQSFTASTHFGFNKGYTLDISAGYANNTAQHDSTRQAVAKSQEITERAMERVLTKINKERVQKIIKEFTETNVHEFDNRGSKAGVPPQHITGVYRWVDKKMKNQIYNYGKRTMFEFMIPEPARLHTLATASSKSNTLVAPIDPRQAPDHWKMPSSKEATKDQLKHWADAYGVKLTELPKEFITINTGQIYEKPNTDGGSQYTRAINITDNYSAYNAQVYTNTVRNHSYARSGWVHVEISNFQGSRHGYDFKRSSDQTQFAFGGLNVKGNFTFEFVGNNVESFDFTIVLDCKLSDDFMQAWRQENFDAIIKAYEAAYAEFLVKQKEFEAQAKEEEEKNKEKLGSFYRDMESVILKHNCIAYLLQDYGALGKNFTNNAKSMQDFSIILGDNLEQYTALAKFMEQAFEWSIMDYTFYPYYWGNEEKWQDMYLSQSTDPLFRSFLQAGMARVIVTVKPGFEDAVQFFMCTGKIWNGGEVPVIGDPLYMSIVDELRQPTGVAQGKYWITRIPTTLTILQAESVGLKVSKDQPLPIFVETDPDNCENPKDLEIASPFSLDPVKLEGADEKTTTLPTTIVG
ncbi:hypothetical protein [Chryseobacterium sp.]|uniref:hypothetical protein n=1 Tax=Chryseobacterium sp. TaxID=1871047 RepID=UPI0032191965